MCSDKQSFVSASIRCRFENELLSVIVLGCVRNIHSFPMPHTSNAPDFLPPFPSGWSLAHLSSGKGVSFLQPLYFRNCGSRGILASVPYLPAAEFLGSVDFGGLCGPPPIAPCRGFLGVGGLWVDFGDEFVITGFRATP